MSEQHRLITALILSSVAILAWQYFFAPPTMPPKATHQEVTVAMPVKQIEVAEAVDKTVLIKEGFQNGNRVSINTSALSGSINLVGARIDDVAFQQYLVSNDSNSDRVTFFAPSQAHQSYFSEVGWTTDQRNLILPTSQTVWKASKRELKENDSVTLYWISPQNIKFSIEIALDDHYMFDIKKSVTNLSNEAVELQSYYLLSRSFYENKSNVISHEGVIGVMGGILNEVTFEDLLKKRKIGYEHQNGGWIGFSDKYWLAAIIPAPELQFKEELIAFDDRNKPKFQVSVLENKVVIQPSTSSTSQVRLFTGVKKLDLLDEYQNKYHIALFDRAVDFGMLYFITKPIFILLSYFYKLIGNFGLAILLLTVVIKILLFPLSYKGFKGMNRLKDLQPQIALLKERCKDDSTMFQKGLMELYKKEKVNPLSGCLPLLLQMPIFFALYKVLYVTLEMRHAPFFLWIHDLSAPDPTTIFNLFGLIPWTPPSFLEIGVCPIIMAITIYIQQKLSPAPPDPVQEKVMSMLPVIFLFVFASFPSGLVIYWAWSNILSIIQQSLIKKLTKC
ncbi:membrane protein insertase YidC [Rickettsiales endosymbiont of Peranema trichophorum]|uniref:membrane protein insertase YidC n=1 Tax=Rickettsiales endosymbiont of Peranema trichophorum TaxID=2486577 RepID=UPI001023E601|nr:membrane protein insertase YidC [Rickettsiales endosymbiont of Peranema trichophorum]RZI47590.1 membrane protein insertase YidC [Rickettsiales endosymbiont of Peranema trichophorum]